MKQESIHAPQKRWPHIGFFAFVILFSIVYYAELLGKLPYGIHDWAQADRLSLAINFYDHGMNFFKPATHSLFSVEGVVGVEFPLQSYLAATLGFIFGRSHIVTCYRVMDILIAIGGLYALFLTVYKRTGDFICSLFVPCFFFCSPVYVYYSGNFLPDAAATSICFIGLYFLFNYLDGARIKDLYKCTTILALAVLVKASVVTYFAGVSLFVLVRMWRGGDKAQRKQAGFLLLFILALCALIALNIWYIHYLNARYKSGIFLSQTLPFKSWQSFVDYIDFGFKDRWMPEYLLPQQYLVYLFLVVTGLTLSFRVKSNRELRPLILLFTLGACTIAYLFGEQLIAHDYYILPMFFPLLAFLLVLSVLAIRQQLTPAFIRPVRAGLLVVILCTFFFADHQIYQRHKVTGIYYDSRFSKEWLYDAAKVLDSLQVPKEAPVLVVDNAPNLGLLYCDRKGYNIPRNQVVDPLHLDHVRSLIREKKVPVVVAEAAVIDSIRTAGSTRLRDFTVYTHKDLAVLRYTGAY